MRVRGLFPALPNSYFEADHTVVVAKGQEGNIARNVIFRLNNLLGSLRNVSRISECEVVLNLALDGDRGSAGGRRRFSVQALRIDSDRAVPQQASRPAADGGVEGLGQYGAGRLLSKWRRPGLLQLCRLLLGLTEGEQTDDVSNGKRGLRVISQIKLVDLSREIHRDVVVANVG